MRSLIPLSTAALIVGMSSAFADDMPPAHTAQTSLGPALADSSGMTLYIFARDIPGKSNCNDQCATNWPPLKAGDDATASGDWTIIIRDDGGKQWAYKGKPLYTWSKDMKAGDTTGNGAANGAWHIASP